MWAEIPGATQGTIEAPHSLHVGTGEVAPLQSLRLLAWKGEQKSAHPLSSPGVLGHENSKGIMKMPRNGQSAER